jgi:serine protease
VFNDYTDQVAAGRPVMTGPPPGSTLSGDSPTFAWSAGVGVSEYWLFVGSFAYGGADLYNQSAGTNLSAALSGLPIDGRTLYVRLWSLISGNWVSNDYTYKALPGP